MPKEASAGRAHGVLIEKKRNKCTLSILVPNLFLDRQRIISIQRNISIHWYLGCLHETEIRIFQNTDWAEKKEKVRH